MIEFECTNEYENIMFAERRPMVGPTRKRAAFELCVTLASFLLVRVAGLCIDFGRRERPGDGESRMNTRKSEQDIVKRAQKQQALKASWTHLDYVRFIKRSDEKEMRAWRRKQSQCFMDFAGESNAIRIQTKRLLSRQACDSLD